MGKKDLIGGSLWDQYSRQVVERMNRPRYRGELTQADAEKAGGKLIVVNDQPTRADAAAALRFSDLGEVFDRFEREKPFD